MNWIQGWDRNQQHLLPAQVEDFVGPDNPVRFLDAFVDGLDLRQAGFVFPKENSQGRGRPSFHPALLLKLYLYGYLHQIRSSRRLEKECQRNLEVIWLTGHLAPDHKTIADFRKDNAAGFKAVVREFTRLCRQMSLFGGELLAIDGTKIKAQNSPAKSWSKSKLEKQLDKAEERLDEYLKALEEADRQPETTVRPVNRQELERKIQKIRERQNTTQQRLKQLQETGETQLSATDPQSRGMVCQGKYVVGYNVQGVIDAKHHLLVATEVTNSPSDKAQLAVMAEEAKSQLKIKQATLLADGGYFEGLNIKQTLEMGFELHVPPGQNSPSERAGLYGKADFTYDAQRNLYLCPNRAELELRRRTQEEGKLIFHYDNPKACAQCALKSRCTKSKHRTVRRWEHESCIEQMLANMAAHPEKFAARKTLIEHAWGTVKWLLPGGFLVRGMKKVGAEVSLAHWAYNFKRLLAVVGFKDLMAAVRRFEAKLGFGGHFWVFIKNWVASFGLGDAKFFIFAAS
jgi:transposase